jgi:aryl-alcohol dehydrogenase-like predicted oxidoreductase
MQFRELGKTGIQVSEIGFGAWAIGGEMWGKQDDDDSIAALHKALDLGCNFFDTALAYGNGHSEKLIQRVLKERGVLNEVIVATKVPPMNDHWDPPTSMPIGKAFPPDWIIQCCERSLKNLGRDYVDILQLHTWNPAWSERVEWHAAMLKLKEQGKIRVIAISVSAVRHDEANPLIQRGRVESVQVIHNILDQTAEKNLFPLAQKKGVGVLSRVPLASGALTGKFTRETKFPKGDWRSERPQKNWVAAMTEDGTPLAHAALKYCLAHPVVSSVIPGIRNARQAELNMSASDGKPMPIEHVTRLHQLYRKKEIGGLFFT